MFIAWCCMRSVQCRETSVWFSFIDSFSSQPKSKPCLVKRASSGDMSDSEYVTRDGAASEGAVGGDSATLTAMQLTTLTLAVTPGTVQKHTSPCSGIAFCRLCHCQFIMRSHMFPLI